MWRPNIYKGDPFIETTITTYTVPREEPRCCRVGSTFACHSLCLPDRVFWCNLSWCDLLL